MRKNLPLSCGLFDTVYTTVVVNQDYSEWHYDPQDCGLTAVVYIGEFIGGELLLGRPCNLKITVGNMDLIFLNSLSVYHRSLPFTGKKLVLGFYSSKYTLKAGNK